MNSYGVLMQNFEEVLKNKEYAKKPWLIIGKGPSYRKLNDELSRNYNTVSLNHVVRNNVVDFSHIIDIDVVAECGSEIYKNASYLVMPFYPHVNNKATGRTLYEFFEDYPCLKKMSDEKRLLWYNSSSSKLRRDEYQVIPVRYFSADAVVALLAYSGVKNMRTIGVDGGGAYNHSFDDMKDKTLLSNGQPSFNVQFRAIATTLSRTGAEMLPIDMNEPVKIYVGSQKEQVVAVKVLEYSIRKNTNCSVDVIPMHLANIDLPIPKDAENKPRTPFSFQRFIIPQLNNFKGRAIYLDSDMQVFCDIRDIWGRDFGESNLLAACLTEGSKRVPQFSVMLLDCSELRWTVEDVVMGLDKGRYTYEELMYEMCVAKVSSAIEGEWNSLECFDSSKTKLLHYTDMNKQPWISRKNPLRNIWVVELKEAISEGFIGVEEVVEGILRGDLRPSLYTDLKKKKHNRFLLDVVGCVLDVGYCPPHKLWNRSKKANIVTKFMGGVVALTFSQLKGNLR